MLLVIHILLLLALVLLFVSLLCFIDINATMTQQMLKGLDPFDNDTYKEKLAVISSVSFAIAMVLIVVSLIMYHGSVV